MKRKMLRTNVSLSLAETQISSVTSEYSIGPLIGTGAFGTVNQVTHKFSGALRAMKTLPKKNMVKDLERRTKFIKEIELMRKLDHPNILNVYELFEDIKNYYIIEEYIAGGELFDQIVERGKFSEEEAANFMIQLLSCLAYCHQNGIMHRDIKPENIMLIQSPKKVLIKLIDWGSAEYFKSGQKFRTTIGTPLYMAPEILLKKYDEKCDIWSCGIILYILLSGKPPFQAPTRPKLLQMILKSPRVNLWGPDWKNVSENAKNILMKMLQPNPEKRSSAKSLLTESWIQEFDKPLGISSIILNNLRKFYKETKLHQAVIWFISVNLTYIEEGQEIIETFQYLDKDADGILDRDELFVGLSQAFGEDIALEECDKIIDAIDVNHSGKVEYSEFMMAAINREKLLSLDNLEYTFREFSLADKGNDTIMAESLKPMLFPGKTYDEKVWREFLSKIDLNSDGLISLFEFKNFILKYCESFHKKLDKFSQN